jgi:hypothetical protein
LSSDDPRSSQDDAFSKVLPLDLSRGTVSVFLGDVYVRSLCRPHEMKYFMRRCSWHGVREDGTGAPPYRWPLNILELVLVSSFSQVHNWVL